MPVTILRGVPYSGKSHYARELQPNSHCVCSADDFHITPEGVYDFKLENAAEAHLGCFRKFNWLCLNAETDTIVVDNTNIKLWEVSPYVMVAKAYGHPVTVVEIACPMDELLRRRASRAEKVIPMEIIEKMLASFEPSLKQWETFELDPSLPRPVPKARP